MQTGGRTDLAVELREDFSEDDERIKGVTVKEEYLKHRKVHQRFFGLCTRR